MVPSLYTRSCVLSGMDGLLKQRSTVFGPSKPKTPSATISQPPHRSLRPIHRNGGAGAQSNCYPLTSASSLRLQLLGNCQLLQVAGSKRRCQVSYGDPGAMRGQTCLQQRLCFLTSLLMLGSVLGSSRTRIKPSDTALSAPLQIPHDTTTANKLSTQRYTDKSRRRDRLVTRLHFEQRGRIATPRKTEIV